VAARFDQERARVKLWLKDVAQARTCASGSVTTRQLEAVSGLLPERIGREEGLDLLNRRPKHTLTLVYGAGNEEHNEAVVLKRILEGYRMEDEL